MKKILFLITELQRPVGGLYRFTTELLPAWRQLVQNGETEFEPLVVSLREPLAPLGDLQLANEFAELMHYDSRLKVYTAERGGEKCYFLDASLNVEERNQLHRELWDKYRVRSEKAAQWDFYQNLNAYWRFLPDFAEVLAKQNDIALIDAQDWLAFPAGFLAKERIHKPLHCRFHSGEMGRSLGRPDEDGAPLRIETAALQEADYVSGVSVTEAKFEVYGLMPRKEALSRELAESRGERWREEQKWKERRFEEFLLLESEDLELITQTVAGIPNGIILDPWRQLPRDVITEGRDTLQRLLPGKDKFVTFIGRPEYRKGIQHLLQAFAGLEYRNAGLLILSSMSEVELAKFRATCHGLGIEGAVQIYNGWVDERMKKGIFCATDILALPSLYEPFGLVTLEGLAADLTCHLSGAVGPVCVVGDTGGMHEVIRNGVNGFKVPMEEDRFDLQPHYLSVVIDLALRNPQLHARISRGGAERAQNFAFNWGVVAQNIFKAYRHAQENCAFWHKDTCKTNG